MRINAVGWVQHPLRYFLGGVIDYRGKTPPPSSTGIPVITAAHVKNGSVIHCGKKFIAADVYNRWTTRGFIKPGDVLVTTEAPVGEVALVPSDCTYLIARRVIALQVDPSRGNEQFIKYVFLSSATREHLETVAHGTTVPRLYKEDILDLPIRAPSVPAQNRIASILSAYDDLIENNTRRISILEETAQALYREWFVNFRFPGHEHVEMVESEVGSVPAGWEVRRLGSVAQVNARSIRKGSEPEDILYIDISSASTGAIGEPTPMKYADAPSRARRIVQNGDVIWSTVRPNRKVYGLVLQPQPNLVVSTGFAVVSSEDLPFSYLYHALTADEFADYLTLHAKGSAYPAVSGSDFESADVLVPDAAVMNRFHELVAPLLELKENLRQKNGALRRTRDLLLPRLISGEIEVAAAEDALAGAVA